MLPLICFDYVESLTCWVELDEFEILQRETSAGDHGVSVTGACVG